jgi:(p)ppGpp synthase/HD superfamily hydrolase
MMRPTIEDAVSLAALAHRGQLDMAGEPYILHPLRVMLQMNDEAARIVAILHDVLEDTTVTSSELRQAGYGEETIEAIEALSKRDGETYEELIGRAAANPVARRVKLADLADNMDRRRLKQTGERDEKRLERYEAARRRLIAVEEGDSGGRRY